MKRTDTYITISCSLILGVICGILRHYQLAVAYDAEGLAIRGHIATTLLLVFAIGGFLLLTALAMKAKGPLHASICFGSQRITPAVTLAGGLLMAISGAAGIPNVVDSYYNPIMFQLLINYFTILAGLCLTVHGMASLLGSEGGQKPTLLLATFCLGGRLVLSYREVSALPVVWDYIFHLVALLLVTSAICHIAGIFFQDAKPRTTLFLSLTGTMLSIIPLFEGRSFHQCLFFIGCTAVMAADSCAIMLAVGKEPPQDEDDEFEESDNAPEPTE